MAPLDRRGGAPASAEGVSVCHLVTPPAAVRLRGAGGRGGNHPRASPPGERSPQRGCGGPVDRQDWPQPGVPPEKWWLWAGQPAGRQADQQSPSQDRAFCWSLGCPGSRGSSHPTHCLPPGQGALRLSPGPLPRGAVRRLLELKSPQQLPLLVSRELEPRTGLPVCLVCRTNLTCLSLPSSSNPHSQVACPMGRKQAQGVQGLVGGSVTLGPPFLLTPLRPCPGPGGSQGGVRREQGLMAFPVASWQEAPAAKALEGRWSEAGGARLCARPQARLGSCPRPPRPVCSPAWSAAAWPGLCAGSAISRRRERVPVSTAWTPGGFSGLWGQPLGRAAHLSLFRLYLHCWLTMFVALLHF